MDLMEMVKRLAKETDTLYTGKGAGPYHKKRVIKSYVRKACK